MTSHSRFENLRISDSDDDDYVAPLVSRNNNNNININNNSNTNNSSSINFISQSIANDKSEVVKNTAADFTSVDVCNDLFSVTNVTQPLPSQSTKVSAPIGSASEHSAASSHNAPLIDNDNDDNNVNENKTYFTEIASNNQRNVVPLATNEEDNANMTLNEPDIVNTNNNTNEEATANTISNNIIIGENNNDTKNDNEFRHRHKRVRRPRHAHDQSSKLLTEGATSKELLNSTQKSFTVNQTRNNNNNNNNNNTTTTTRTITDAEQEQSIKFEEVTQNVPQSNPFTTSNKTNVCNAKTTNIIGNNFDSKKNTLDSSSELPKSSQPMILSNLLSQTTLPSSSELLSSHQSISPPLPRRDPVIPSPSELDPPFEQSSSFIELEEEHQNQTSPHVKSKVKPHDLSPRGKVVPVIDNEGKQVWMMTVSSHVSKRQTHRVNNSGINDNHNEDYSTEEEEEELEEEEKEEVVQPLFAIRPPPRHLSRRAQNIMHAAIQAMESKIRERHAAAVKAAVQENMAITHQVYNLPNLFIYSIANNPCDSTPLTNNYNMKHSPDASSSSTSTSSSSRLLPPPHMRLKRNNSTLSPHEREWCTHRYDTHIECDMVYKKWIEFALANQCKAEQLVRRLQPIQVACEPSNNGSNTTTINNTQMSKEYNVKYKSINNTLSGNDRPMCGCVVYDMNTTGVSGSLNVFSENAIWALLGNTAALDEGISRYLNLQPLLFTISRDAMEADEDESTNHDVTTITSTTININTSNMINKHHNRGNDNDDDCDDDECARNEQNRSSRPCQTLTSVFLKEWRTQRKHHFNNNNSNEMEEALPSAQMHAAWCDGLAKSVHNTAGDANTQTKNCIVDGLVCAVQLLPSSHRTEETESFNYLFDRVLGERRVMRICGGQGAGLIEWTDTNKVIDVRCYELFLFPHDLPPAMNGFKERLLSDGNCDNMKQEMMCSCVDSIQASTFATPLFSIPLTPRLINDASELKEYKHRLLITKPQEVIMQNTEEERLTFYTQFANDKGVTYTEMREPRFVLLTLPTLSIQRKYTIELTQVLLPCRVLCYNAGKAIVEVPCFNPSTVLLHRKLNSIALSFTSQCTFLAAYRALMWSTECNFIDLTSSFARVMQEHRSLSKYITLRTCTTSCPLLPWSSFWGNYTYETKNSASRRKNNFNSNTNVDRCSNASSKNSQITSPLVQRNGNSSNEEEQRSYRDWCVDFAVLAKNANNNINDKNETLLQLNEFAFSHDAGLTEEESVTGKVTGYVPFGLVERAISELNRYIYDVQLYSRNRLRLAPLFTPAVGNLLMHSAESNDQLRLEHDVAAALLMEYTSHLPFMSNVSGVLMDAQHCYIFQEPWLAAITLEQNTWTVNNNNDDNNNNSSLSSNYSSTNNNNEELKMLQDYISIVTLKDFIHAVLKPTQCKTSASMTNTYNEKKYKNGSLHDCKATKTENEESAYTEFSKAQGAAGSGRNDSVYDQSVNDELARLELAHLIATQLLLHIIALHGRGLLLGPCPPQRVMVRITAMNRSANVQNHSNHDISTENEKANRLKYGRVTAECENKNKNKCCEFPCYETEGNTDYCTNVMMRINGVVLPVSSRNVEIFFNDVGINSTAWSFNRQQCGVMEYLPPHYLFEQMLGEDIGKETRPWTLHDDWWCYLCLLFELFAADGSSLVMPSQLLTANSPRPYSSLSSPLLTHFTNPSDVLEVWRSVLAADDAIDANNSTCDKNNTENNEINEKKKSKGESSQRYQNCKEHQTNNHINDDDENYNNNNKSQSCNSTTANQTRAFSDLVRRYVHERVLSSIAPILDSWIATRVDELIYTANVFQTETSTTHCEGNGNSSGATLMPKVEQRAVALATMYTPRNITISTTPSKNKQTQETNKKHHRTKDVRVKVIKLLDSFQWMLHLRTCVDSILDVVFPTAHVCAVHSSSFYLLSQPFFASVNKEAIFDGTASLSVASRQFIRKYFAKSHIQQMLIDYYTTLSEQVRQESAAMDGTDVLFNVTEHNLAHQAWYNNAQEQGNALTTPLLLLMPPPLLTDKPIHNANTHYNEHFQSNKAVNDTCRNTNIKGNTHSHSSGQGIGYSYVSGGGDTYNNVDDYLSQMYYDGLVYSPIDNNVGDDAETDAFNNLKNNNAKYNKQHETHTASIKEHLKRNRHALHQRHRKFREMYDYNDLQAIRDINVELHHALEANHVIHSSADHKNNIDTNTQQKSKVTRESTDNQGSQSNNKNKNNLRANTVTDKTNDPELNEYYYDKQHKLATQAAKEQEEKEEKQKEKQKQSKIEQKAETQLCSPEQSEAQKEDKPIKVKRPHTHTHKLHSTRVSNKEIVNNTSKPSSSTIELRSTTHVEPVKASNEAVQQESCFVEKVQQSGESTNIQGQSAQMLLRDPLASNTYSVDSASNVQNTIYVEAAPATYNYNDIELSLNELARPSTNVAFSTYVVRMPNESEPRSTYAPNDWNEEQQYRYQT